MSARDGARRDAGRLEVEHDGLGGDDAALGGGHRAGYGTGGHDAARAADPLVDVDRFIASQPGQLAPARAAHRGRGGPAARLTPGARSTSSSSSTSARRPTCPTPGPSRPTLRWSAGSPASSRTPPACSTAPGRRSLAGVARFFTTSFPAAVWHARRFVLVSALLLFLPGRRDGHLARRLRRGPGGRRARGRCGRPTWRRTSRRTTRRRRRASSPPQVTVNNIQVAFLAFAAGILLCVVDRVHPASSTAPTSGRPRGCSRPPASRPKFYGLILPARPARAVRHHRGRRRRAWPSGGPSSTPATGHARSRRWPSEGRRSAVIVARPGAGVRRRRLDRGRSSRRAGCPRRCASAIGAAVFVAFWTYVVVLGRRAASARLHGSLRRARRGLEQHARRAPRVRYRPPLALSVEVGVGEPGGEEARRARRRRSAPEAAEAGDGPVALGERPSWRRRRGRPRPAPSGGRGGPAHDVGVPHRGDRPRRGAARGAAGPAAATPRPPARRGR